MKIVVLWIAATLFVISQFFLWIDYWKLRHEPCCKESGPTFRNNRFVETDQDEWAPWIARDGTVIPRPTAGTLEQELARLHTPTPKP